jgi:hypothetical protein
MKNGGKMIESKKEKILSEITKEYKQKISKADITDETISYFAIAEKKYKDNNLDKVMTIRQFYELIIAEFVKSITEDEK